MVKVANDILILYFVDIYIYYLAGLLCLFVASLMCRFSCVYVWCFVCLMYRFKHVLCADFCMSYGRYFVSVMCGNAPTSAIT